MWNYQNSDELYHHGILGMKWGVRRYQNKDGSLTSAGKKRKKQRYESADEKEANKLRKKKSYELSNAEIRKVNERRRLENEYNRLNPTKLAAGAAAVTGALVVIGKVAGAADNINKLSKSTKIFRNGAKRAGRAIKKVGSKIPKHSANVIKGQMSLF